MDYYHGSVIPHLTELRPFEGKENNLKKPCVYLTTNPQLAIHYIRDKSRLWISPTLDVREDGVLVYQEMFSNALEYMYKGISGYVACGSPIFSRAIVHALLSMPFSSG